MSDMTLPENVLNIEAHMKALEGDFLLQLTRASNVKGAMKLNGATSDDLWMMPISALHVIEGFNPRVETPELEAKSIEYGESMIANGYYKHSVMAGYPAVKNGETIVYITAGHTRLKSIAYANSRGANIQVVPVAVSTKGVSREDLTFALVEENKANPLSVYEVAVLVRRLHGWGVPQKEIGRRLQFTVNWVGKLLDFMAAPYRLKEMVARGQVAITLVFELADEYGFDTALDMLTAAAEKKEKSGRSPRVTGKDLSRNRFATFAKRAALPMYSLLETVHADPGFASLAPETQNLLAELITSLAGKKDGQEGGAANEVDSRQETLFEAVR